MRHLNGDRDLAARLLVDYGCQPATARTIVDMAMSSVNDRPTQALDECVDAWRQRHEARTTKALFDD